MPGQSTCIIPEGTEHHIKSEYLFLGLVIRFPIRGTPSDVVCVILLVKSKVVKVSQARVIAHLCRLHAQQF